MLIIVLAAAEKNVPLDPQRPPESEVSMTLELIVIMPMKHVS
jgi:hypothetical protein